MVSPKPAVLIPPVKITKESVINIPVETKVEGDASVITPLNLLAPPGFLITP